MTEIEYAVDASSIISGTIVIIDDKQFAGLSPAEIRSLIIDKANQEDNWMAYDDEERQDITYEVYEN
jgi:hypothetical protein